MDNQFIAKRISKLRKDNNLTLDEFAEIAGIKNKSTICRWESGDITSLKTTTVKRLADHFHINPSWLIFEEDTRMKPYTKEERELQAEIENLVDSMDENQLRATLVFVKTIMGVKE